MYNDFTHIKQSVIWKKITHFCTYQERCHQEVKQKLHQLGIYHQQADAFIACLIQENYLNEERFAREFALGKFNRHQWGKRKIAFALKQKQISDYLIKRALLEIDEQAYADALRKIISRRIQASKGLPAPEAKQKIWTYLLQKGYEPEWIELIWQEYKQEEI
ncbi:MAG: RecX family transcriptional regulator [Thermoflavifilum sp.]|nr:RecX family transcriptional regulator [Thermoflavifilum sp.]